MGRLFNVSNRLPIVLQHCEGDLVVKAGTGGLVTALAPILRDHGGVWLGWPGLADLNPLEAEGVISEAGRENGFTYEPVFLSKKQVQFFYEGFSNEVLWPLFHDLQSMCCFKPEYWETYCQVNELFAKRVKEGVLEHDTVWIHDYHLMLLGQSARQFGVKNRMGFFLHIPFPPSDIYVKLPWRKELLNALFYYDVLGFQTDRDSGNFIQCVRMLFPECHVSETRIECGSRSVEVGVFPISIDFKEFDAQSRSKQVEEEAWRIHASLPDRKLILCVDRLDYTKGIPYRLQAFCRLLEHHPEWLENVSLVQVMVPSRINIAGYQELKEEVDRLVGEINSTFSRNGWVPIHYMYRHLSREELVSYYRTAEIAFVTPIKDGMNLVAKEYVASNCDESGVLILSEFAGATSELHRDALLVNPCDVVGMSDTLVRALEMSENERKERMRRMREWIATYDIHHWTRSFLDRVEAGLIELA